jgi:hypothetical protein
LERYSRRRLVPTCHLGRHKVKANYPRPQLVPPRWGRFFDTFSVVANGRWEPLRIAPVCYCGPCQPRWSAWPGTVLPSTKPPCPEAGPCSRRQGKTVTNQPRLIKSGCRSRRWPARFRRSLKSSQGGTVHGSRNRFRASVASRAGRFFCVTNAACTRKLLSRAENKKRYGNARQRYAVNRPGRTTTNVFRNSNNLNVLGFNHLVDIEGGHRFDPCRAHHQVSDFIIIF